MGKYTPREQLAVVFRRGEWQIEWVIATPLHCHHRAGLTGVL
jgi:hypothetical protein